MRETTTYLNFLPYVNDIYSLCKQLKFYNNVEYKKETSLDTNEWPGIRTTHLDVCSPFLYIHILTLLNQKLILSNYKGFSMVCHLRLQEDEQKDFIHVDDTDTALIYLSPTNLNSGTNFFDDNQNVVASTKFVQGACVFFKSGILHSSFGNHGDSLENGRMTLNIFMHHKNDN